MNILKVAVIFIAGITILFSQDLQREKFVYSQMYLGNNVDAICKFPLDQLDSIQVLSYNHQMIGGACFAYDTLYGIETIVPGIPHILLSIDTSTGITTRLAVLDSIKEQVTSMVWDPTTRKIFISTIFGYPVYYSKLYELDSFTRQTTFIGQIGTYVIWELSCSKDGILYGYTNYLGSKILKINKDNGNPTIIGSTGLPKYESTAMSFDPTTDELYLVTTNGSFSELRKVTVNNGITNLVGLFPQNIRPFFLAFNTDAGSLEPFQLQTPPSEARVMTRENSEEPFIADWDTSRSKATYRFIFGSPEINSRKFEFFIYNDSLRITLGKLDSLLASLGLNHLDSISGQWDVWAYRGNYNYDSLKSSNGPRTITFKRLKPVLSSFHLMSPPDNSTIITSEYVSDTLKIRWSPSGEGVKYRFKFFTQDRTILSLSSDNGGYDNQLIIKISGLDTILAQSGIRRGDSISGKWSIWSYSGTDSLSSAEEFNLTLGRTPLAEFLVAYDTTYGSADRDSVLRNLDLLGRGYDLFLHTNKSLWLNNISLSGYKYVIWLGNGGWIFQASQKDSIKKYLENGGAVKPNFIIFSYWVNSSLFDTLFIHQFLGYKANGSADPSFGYVILGDGINAGIPDSLKFNIINFIGPSWIGGSKSLYKFERFPGEDSLFAIGRIGENWNTVVVGADVKFLRSASTSPPGSPVTRMLTGVLQFLDEWTPVELTSFTSHVIDDDIYLEWRTATETNNKGFELFRKKVENESVWQLLSFNEGAGTSSQPKIYSYTDKDLNSGSYRYRLLQLDFDGSRNEQKEIEIKINKIPVKFSLGQNYPNPFNPTTTIKYSLPHSGRVTLSIYDLLGREVITLIDEEKPAGEYETTWNASRYPSGVYFLKMQAGQFTQTRKLILVK